MTFALVIDDFRKIKCDGPVPPEGVPPYRYISRLAAIGTECISQPPKLTVAEMLEAAQDYVLETTELVASHQR